MTTKPAKQGRHLEFFHISPDADIDRMRGRWHHRFQEKGIFVAPSYRSIVMDWFGHVGSKKQAKLQEQGRDGEGYRFLTIYRLSIPQQVVDACMKQYGPSQKICNIFY